MALFDEIEVFARVVECGGITSAAERLKLSKSRVSECVRALEARLGERLLERSTRRVAPTEAGAIFYGRCVRALDEAQAGVAEILARRDEPAGHLRIGSPDLFAELYLVPALAGFLAQHPKVTAEIVEDARVTNLVAERLDLTIRIVREPDEAAIVRQLGTSEVVLCAAPALLAARGAPAHPSEIGAWPCIGFAFANWWREWRFEEPEPLVIPVKPLMSCNATSALKAAALAGIGLVPIPRWAIAAELAAGRLVSVFPGWRLLRSGIYAVYPSNRLVTTKVRRFVEHLAPLLREV